MKKLTWTTTSEFVDKDTGEVLTKQEVEEKYIITKKTKKHEITQRYVREKNGGYLLTKFGVIRITNECTRTGKQLQIKW